MNKIDMEDNRQLLEKLEKLKGYLIEHENHSANIRCIEYIVRLLTFSPLSNKDKLEVEKAISYLLQPRNLPDNSPADVPFIGCGWLEFLEDIRNATDKIVRR